MFYLTKFCRICVKPSERLLELSRRDYDRVTFEEKLEACTKMVVAKEDPSPHICAACVRKLRISYDFRDMCLKSDGIIRGYIAELLGEKKELAETFDNAELRIVVSPIPEVTLQVEMDKYLESVSNKENNNLDEVCSQSNVDVKPDISSILFQNLQYGNRCRPTYHQQGVIVKREVTDVTQECANSLEVRVPRNSICEDPYLQKDRESPMSQNHYSSSHPAPASKKQETPLRRKRVSKDQRCSLLRKFLSNNIISTNKASTTPRIARMTIPHALTKKRGGLKDLLGFIKGYDFGYDLKAATEQSQETPLDKLENFSKTFFYSDFTAYRNTILAVIKSNETETSDDDDMLNPYDEEEDRRLWFGNVKQEMCDESNLLVNIKQEPGVETEEVYLEPEVHIKTELMDENEEEYLPSELVQACYSEDNSQKPHEDGPNSSFVSKYPPTMNNNFPGCYPSTSGMPSSLEMLQRFTNWAKRGGRKVISPNSLKCRTRGRPFINPQLMEQFKSRSFKCDKCHRSFKSLGYLQSHCTKMGH